MVQGIADLSLGVCLPVISFILLPDSTLIQAFLFRMLAVASNNFSTLLYVSLSFIISTSLSEYFAIFPCIW
jgi:hypothetical protein